MSEIVTLVEVESYDSRPAAAGRDERRYLCCLSASCRQKPRDAAHRSLCVNVRTGAFFCHRCDARGKLKEFWEQCETKRLTKRQKAKSALNTRFAIAPDPEPRERQPPEKLEQLQTRMANWRAEFLNSPAEMYLIGRGILPETASEFGCGYAARWEHWENEHGKWRLAGTDQRVVFPITGKTGELVAVQARAIDKNFCGAEKLTRGDKSLGIFQPPAVFSKKPVAICEGPVDALALAACGVAAIAMMGTNFPDWLALKLGFKAVLLATDADEAGDQAAAKLDGELTARGARTLRLSPRTAKDWAEALEKIGIEKLTERLASFGSTADDELRVNAAWLWHKANRDEAARFAARLIENGECREWLLTKFAEQKPV